MCILCYIQRVEVFSDFNCAGWGVSELAVIKQETLEKRDKVGVGLPDRGTDLQMVKTYFSDGSEVW